MICEPDAHGVWPAHAGSAYYNEIDLYAATWLSNLIAGGEIAPGVVDTRSIMDVKPNDLKGFTQCHFFAGIGIWSRALRDAGWSDDKPVWTGSCPCQPFSTTGKRSGVADDRHLWPDWNWLISQCKPSVIFGEQVASKDGLNWSDIVQTNLENQNYAVGIVDTCSAGFGAPHIRQRLWFVAYTGDERLERHGAGSGAVGGVELSQHQQQRSTVAHETRTEHPVGSSETSGVGDTHMLRTQGGPGEKGNTPKKSKDEMGIKYREWLRSIGVRASSVSHPWTHADWLWCRDNKWRPVEPDTFPLANGDTTTVGRLRAYGNAINLEAATEFIKAAC